MVRWIKRNNMAVRRQARRTRSGLPAVKPLLGAVAIVLLCLSSVWGARIAVESARDSFPFQALKVEGEFAQVTTRQVYAVVEPMIQGGFFDVDIASIKQALEKVAWIQSVSVRRVWPDTLHIVVTERNAKARWRAGGLVGQSGELFFPEDSGSTSQLPVLSGPLASQALLLEQLELMNRVLTPVSLAVVELEMDERRAFRLRLNNGVVVTLGRRDGVERLQRFVKYFASVLAGQSSDMEGVDMRYSNGFAVKWKQRPDGPIDRTFG